MTKQKCIKTEVIVTSVVDLRCDAINIRYKFHQSEFGKILVGAVADGFCYLGFVDEESSALEDLRGRFPFATITEGSVADPLQLMASGEPIRLCLYGTDFQQKVWRALLETVPGAVVTYADIALAVGNPGAVRAVGTAVAGNPIAIIIPCHRVIRSDGKLGNYRYGAGRKAELLRAEGINGCF